MTTEKSVTCPNCGRDVMKTGYRTETRSYQCYVPAAGGKLVRSHTVKGKARIVQCLVCSAGLSTEPSELESAAA